MLEVVELDEQCSIPEIGGDEHVPMMIRWGLTTGVIWRANFQNGQICCELKVASVGGRVYGFTILNPPPVSTGLEESTGTWEEAGVPIVSLKNFDLNPDLVPQQKLVEVSCSPKAVRHGKWLETQFGDNPIERWAMSAVSYTHLTLPTILLV